MRQQYVRERYETKNVDRSREIGDGTLDEGQEPRDEGKEMRDEGQ